MSATLWRRHLSYRLRQLGLPGMAGLALLAGAAAYFALVTRPAAALGLQLRTEIVAVGADICDSEPDERATTPAEQLAAFYESFPKDTAVPDWLGKIYAIAAEHRLSLELGEYSLTQAQSGRLDRFRIAFPVRGAYPQIRRFIAAALATAPALALDNLALKRERIGDGSVDARIVFLLYLEKP